MSKEEKKVEISTEGRLISREQSTGERPRYRVWRAYNIPNNMDYYAVGSPEEARALIDTLAKADLEDESIVSSAFGLEEFEEGSYHEWYDEDGRSVEDEE